MPKSNDTLATSVAKKVGSLLGTIAATTKNLVQAPEKSGAAKPERTPARAAKKVAKKTATRKPAKKAAKKSAKKRAPKK
jgi:hypothetical protein